MTRVLMTLAILAALAPLPGVALGPIVLLIAAAVAAFAVDCLRWPGYFAPPAGPTYPKGWNR